MSSTSTRLNGRFDASKRGAAMPNGNGRSGRRRPRLTVSTSPDRRQRSGVWTRVVDRNRRALNVVVAAVGIIVTLPLMALIAIGIKLTSRGPVFYSQKRVGLDRRSPARNLSQNGRRHLDRGGRIFTIYKFRTMTAPGGDSGQTWASPDDPRITRFGAILRKYRLDELPQLLNVLQGDMNIVGPRPEQPDIFLQLREAVEGYQHRQRVLPGITGWAQVNHSYDQCLDDVRRKVLLDLEYIQRRSTAEDLKIMAKTLPVMAGKKGAV